MVRITTKKTGTVTIVRVDGRLHKNCVAELEKVCGSIEGALCLDLANLQSLDACAARYIAEIETRGAAITGMSPYIEMLLKRVNE